MTSLSAIAPRPKLVVSAYVDAKAQNIEDLNLNRIGRFEDVKENAGDDVSISIEGRRHSKLRSLGELALSGAVPALLGGVAGAAVGGPIGAVVGGLGGFVTGMASNMSTINQLAKARQWPKDSRLQVGQKAVPSPVEHAGAERLAKMVSDNEESFPEARHLVYISGHGYQKSSAEISFEEMSEKMEGLQVDATLFDSCLIGQMEVLSKISPWAGIVLASPHKTRARGYDLASMLDPKTINTASDQEFAVNIAKKARSTTSSFSAVDSRAFREEFLPALDELGASLHRELENGKRSSIKKALAKSTGTHWGFSPKVDMGSFLEQLAEAPLSQETQKKLKTTQAGFDKSVLFQKNKHSFSFDLKSGKTDESLPQGWTSFLQGIDLNHKPLFGPF